MDSMNLKDIAELAGVKLLSARLYHNQATRRRREGTAKVNDMPEPTTFVNGRPYWNRDVIVQWLNSRPGVGRPRKND